LPAAIVVRIACRVSRRVAPGACRLVPRGGRRCPTYNHLVQTTAELREGFLSFFEEKGHLRCPSYSLIPRADDHSTLLTSAGMQPQMPFFLGREPPPAPLTTTAEGLPDGRHRRGRAR